VDNARNILLDLVNLDQIILFWDYSEDLGRKLWLHCLLVFLILILCDSLVRQLYLYFKNLFIFMKNRHTIFVYNGVLFLIIIGEIHFEDLLLHKVVNHP
jgi:hypothetical protein